MIQTVKDIWEGYWLADRHNPFGWQALWDSLKCWYSWRPKVSYCPACGSKLWTNNLDTPTYCDRYCAYYGPDNDTNSNDNEIPF